MGQSVTVWSGWPVSCLMLVVRRLGGKNRTVLTAEVGIHHRTIAEVCGLKLRTPLAVADCVGPR